MNSLRQPPGPGRSVRAASMDTAAPPGFSMDALLNLRQPVEPARKSMGEVLDAILLYDDRALQQALQANPADMDSNTDKDGVTPLQYCIVQGWSEGLPILLRAGANVFDAS